MNTIIRKYESSDKQDCINAFKSNVPLFFTNKEITDFDSFLNKVESGTDITYYYVVIFKEKVIGCGGFGDNYNNGKYTLAWGLIHNDYHKKGFGVELLLHRIRKIKELKTASPLMLDTTQHSFGFFEKHGFRITKITNDFYEKGMHRYDMVLEM